MANSPTLLLRIRLSPQATWHWLSVREIASHVHETQSVEVLGEGSTLCGAEHAEQLCPQASFRVTRQLNAFHLGLEQCLFYLVEGLVSLCSCNRPLPPRPFPAPLC